MTKQPSAIWRNSVAHLVDIANFKKTPGLLRSQAIDSVTSILATAAAAVSQSKDDLLETKSVQMRILSPLSHLVMGEPGNREEADKENELVVVQAQDGTLLPARDQFCCHIDVQRVALETLHRFMQNWGHAVSHGWIIIFDMVRAACVYGATESSPRMVKLTERLLGKCQLGVANLTAGSFGSVAMMKSKFGSEYPGSNSASYRHGNLVKIAFPCLQLVCTDFLAQLDVVCLQKCITTLGAFCLQSEDLNIALTAIGLIWNVSDHLRKKSAEFGKGVPISVRSQEVAGDGEETSVRQALSGTEEKTAAQILHDTGEKTETEQQTSAENDHEKITAQENTAENTPYATSQLDENSVLAERIETEIKAAAGSKGMSRGSLSALWMLVLLQFALICFDPRPEVRHGAIQTLFRTVNINGSSLSPSAWASIIWQVLFPILEAIAESGYSDGPAAVTEATAGNAVAGALHGDATTATDGGAAKGTSIASPPASAYNQNRARNRQRQSWCTTREIHGESNGTKHVC